MKQSTTGPADLADSSGNADPSADPTSADVKVCGNDLESMVFTMFDSMLDLPVEVSNDSATPNPEWWEASINISGSWSATISVTTEKAMAETIAQAMFCVESPDLAESDLHDALGEVVNVIGGNVKGMVNLECSLSLPCTGQANNPLEPQGLVSWFESDGHLMRFIVNENN